MTSTNFEFGSIQLILLVVVYLGAIIEALKCKESGEAKVICFNLCGHGFLDLPAYEAWNAGKLEADATISEADLQTSFSTIPKV